jgi:hypothetical protein
MGVPDDTYCFIRGDAEKICYVIVAIALGRVI